MMFSSEVLPEPDLPTTAMNCPGKTFRFTPRRACTSSESNSYRLSTSTAASNLCILLNCPFPLHYSVLSPISDFKRLNLRD